MLKAQIALKIDNNRLIPAGRGYQPAALFNRGDLIATERQIEERDWHGRCWIKIDGKVYGVRHSDFYNNYPPHNCLH
jgi:hypothetical protein